MNQSNRMKIEMHAHTSETSPCGSVPADTAVREYARAGYGGMVITDHFNSSILSLSPWLRTGKGWIGISPAMTARRKPARRSALTVLLGAKAVLSAGRKIF